MQYSAKPRYIQRSLETILLRMVPGNAPVNKGTQGLSKSSMGRMLDLLRYTGYTPHRITSMKMLSCLCRVHVAECIGPGIRPLGMSKMDRRDTQRGNPNKKNVKT